MHDRHKLPFLFRDVTAFIPLSLTPPAPFSCLENVCICSSAALLAHLFCDLHPHCGHIKLKDEPCAEWFPLVLELQKSCQDQLFRYQLLAAPIALPQQAQTTHKHRRTLPYPFSYGVLTFINMLPLPYLTFCGMPVVVPIWRCPPAGQCRSTPLAQIPSATCSCWRGRCGGAANYAVRC